MPECPARKGGEVGQGGGDRFDKNLGCPARKRGELYCMAPWLEYTIGAFSKSS